MSYLALAVAAQRYVEVVTQPSAQRDVPAAPELSDGRALVGAIKVDVELESHQQGDADGHVAVAREVAVYLQGIAIDTQQVLQAAVERRIGKDTLDKVHADVVADDRLLEESADDEPQSRSHHVARDVQWSADLRDEVAGAHDGSRHQLREERHIEGIVEQRVERTNLATIHVDGVAQRLEGEERDSHGQEDAQVAEMTARELRHDVPEEVGVFEVGQQPQVDRETQCDEPFAGRLALGTVHPLRDEPVAAGDQGEQEEVDAARLVIEEVAERGDEQQTCSQVTVQHGIDHDERGKDPQEHAAAEDHWRLRVIDHLAGDGIPRQVVPGGT